jgi:hypothetical protein
VACVMGCFLDLASSSRAGQQKCAAKYSPKRLIRGGQECY